MLGNVRAIGSGGTKKFAKSFKQLLLMIKTKLPHLLGVSLDLVASAPIETEIKDYGDLSGRFELIDCHSALQFNR